MLWTWERPEDLSFLAGRTEVGVAHLVSTIELRAPDRFDARPNRNPLRLPDDIPRIVVVRIENVRGRQVVARLDENAQSELVAALVDASARLDASGLQLDFDALHSQRDLYRGLLIALRQGLPRDRSLGLTALASWCVGDPWLDHLPDGTVDYAVPMLFRMGTGAPEIRRFVEDGGVFRSSLCHGDLGQSTDEAAPTMGEGVRRWIFSPRAWSPESWASALDSRPPKSNLTTSRSDLGWAWNSSGEPPVAPSTSPHSTGSFGTLLRRNCKALDI